MTMLMISFYHFKMKLNLPTCLKDQVINKIKDLHAEHVLRTVNEA